MGSYYRALPLEFLSSEQIWRSPFGEANPFLPNRGFQTQAGWLPVLARRWLACPTCCELRFPAWGKAVLGDLFSGAVSSELGLRPETHMQRGRQNHMDKSLPSRRALVNLTLSGTFLAPTETPLCVKLGTQHRGTESLILAVQL